MHTLSCVVYILILKTDFNCNFVIIVRLTFFRFLLARPAEREEVGHCDNDDDDDS